MPSNAAWVNFQQFATTRFENLLAGTMREVCHDVLTEPSLQPLSGECFSSRSTFCVDDARLDIAACCFYGGRFERVFFDVRPFNPHASSNLASMGLYTADRSVTREGSIVFVSGK